MNLKPFKPIKQIPVRSILDHNNNNNKSINSEI